MDSEAPSAHPLPRKRALTRWWVLIWSSPFLVLTVIVGSSIQRTEQLRSQAEQQRLITQRLHVLRDRLHAVAQTAFSPTASLVTLVQVDGSVSQDRFSRTIDRSMNLVPYIRSVVAAPDDIARFVHPLAGNERVVNLDYRSIPAQWAQVQQARTSHAPAIFAPVKLVQGGLGIIQRNPIFLNTNGQERYWGVVSVVLDLNQFLAAAGIEDDPELDLALLNVSSAPEQRVVWGSARAAQPDAMSVTANLPGAQWTLSARPRSGWTSGSSWARETWVVLSSGCLVSLLIGLLGYQRDLLRLRHRALASAQADTLAARDRLQAVLDASVETAIISTDLEGRVTVFNRGAQRMLGRTEGQAMGQSPALWHDPQEVAAVGRELTPVGAPTLGGFGVFAALAQTPGQAARDWTFVTADGRRLQVSLALSTVLDADQHPAGYLGVAVDLSAQRQAEAALRQLTLELEHRVQERTTELRSTLAALEQAQAGLLRSEKLAALGALVAGVAHELNTPLGNCLITASALVHRTEEIRKEVALGQVKRSSLAAYLDDAREAGELMMRGLANASDMVRHFKQLSVDQASEQRRHFTLDSVVEDVLSLARVQWKHTPYHIETQLHVSESMDSFPGALGRVLANLLQNALIHAFEGRNHGVVCIRTWMDSPLTLTLEVSDDGNGMDAQTLRCAFDPFYTTKLGHGGSGLGLNIVYNTVTGILGGQIELTSAPDAGTRFLIQLPLVAPTLSVTKP